MKDFNMSNQNSTNQNKPKKVISRQEFDKRIDMERAYCEWTEYMSKPEALETAIKRISKEYSPQKVSN